MSGKFSSIDKLEQLLRRIEDLKKEEIEKEREELKEKDKGLLYFISERGEVTAEDVASFLKISRSNASMRLNRLVRAGLIEKRFKGRKAYFVAFDKDKANKDNVEGSN